MNVIVQDRFAVRSHTLAAAARSQGRFKDEITPVPTKRQDPQTGQWSSVVISEDDGIRPNVDLKTLGKLPSVFKKNGSTTAGNSSQVYLLLEYIHTCIWYRWLLKDSIPDARSSQYPKREAGSKI